MDTIDIFSEVIINAIANYIESNFGMDTNRAKCIHGFGINYCQEFKYNQAIHGLNEILATIPGVGEIRITESVVDEMEKRLSSDQIESLSEKALLNIYPEFSKIIKDEHYKFMANRVKNNIIEF